MVLINESGIIKVLSANHNHMNIKVVTEEFELTEAIADYIYKKLAVIPKHLNQKVDETLVDVILRDETKHRKGKGFTAEINIPVRGGLINVSAEADDLYAAIDAVKDDVVRELEKHNTKHRDVARHDAIEGKEMLKSL